MATDSFAPAVARVAAMVGPTEVILRTIPGTPNTYDDRFTFDVFDAAGEIVNVHHGDLVKQAEKWTLTAGQRAALGNCTTVAAVLKLLQDFMQAKAEGAIG